MAVARISVSLPMEIAKLLNKLVKEKKMTKSQFMTDLVRREKRRLENLQLQQHYGAMAQDPQYQKESAEWIRNTQIYYAKNLPPYEG